MAGAAAGSTVTVSVTMWPRRVADTVKVRGSAVLFEEPWKDRLCWLCRPATVEGRRMSLLPSISSVADSAAGPPLSSQEKACPGCTVRGEQETEAGIPRSGVLLGEPEAESPLTARAERTEELGELVEELVVKTTSTQ